MSVRIGLVGAGNIAKYHVAGFRKSGAEIVALADVSEAARSKAAALYGIPESYPSLERMLSARKDIDAVAIVTPNKFHAPLAIEALGAGRHVYCEKPPALNAAEMAAMKAAAEKAGKLLEFDFNNRARPESLALADYVKAGAFGRINSAQAVWARRAGIPGFGGWFTNKAVSGGGPVIDLPHMLDLALHLMGYPEPAWVLAQTFSDFMGDPAFKGPWGIPDVQGGVSDVESACHAFIRFKSGQVLFVRASWAEMIEREIVSVAVQGTKAGGLVERLFDEDGLDETSRDRCELYTVQNGRQVNSRIIVDKDETMGRVRSAENFIKSIEGSERPFNTPAEALTLMRIVDAMYSSAATGEPVRP